MRSWGKSFEIRTKPRQKLRDADSDCLVYRAISQNLCTNYHKTISFSLAEVFGTAAVIERAITMQQDLDGIEDYGTQTALCQLQAALLKTFLEKVVAEERTEFPVEIITEEVGIALKVQRAVDARFKGKGVGDDDDGAGGNRPQVSEGVQMAKGKDRGQLSELSEDKTSDCPLPGDPALGSTDAATAHC